MTSLIQLSGLAGGFGERLLQHADVAGDRLVGLGVVGKRHGDRRGIGVPVDPHADAAVGEVVAVGAEIAAVDEFRARHLRKSALDTIIAD